MLKTLIALTAFIALLHYTGTEHWIVLLVNQPLEYHLGFIILLVVVRAAKAIYSAYPTVKGLYRSIMRVVNRLDGVASKLEKSNNDNSPFKNGGKRFFSTSGTSSYPGGNPYRSTGKTADMGQAKPGSGSAFMGHAFAKSNDFSKKVMDRFFKTIAKEGTLVSLDKRVMVWSAKHNKYVSRISPFPQLSSLFEKVGFRMFGAVFPAKGKFLSRMRQLNAFMVHLYNMRRHHGSLYVVKYLKSSQLAIQKAIAGTKVTSLRLLDSSIPFPYLASCGLPRFIPLRDRRLILSGAPSVIRWWLTLYSVYRVISVPGKLKLETITQPMTVLADGVLEVAAEIVSIINPTMFETRHLYNTGRFLFLESASAGSRVSWMGLLSDILGLTEEPKVFQALLDYLDMSGNHRLSAMMRFIETRLDMLPNKLGITSNVYKMLVANHRIGKLSLKKEAAGKVRVFAMADVWTQSALKPLHDVLFRFLKSLPNDGTFDQNASVKRCMVKSNITGKSFGYDLSAATDRLPIILQREIIEKLFPGAGDLWTKILVGRPYVLDSEEFGIQDKEFHYATGQPMGAYSSWGMLAVTHHYIAQLAAVKAANAVGTLSGPFWIVSASELQTFNLASPWYTGYEVLGDDIVFFEENVAKEYLKIMDILGVPINLAKSVVATNPTFEFAKVTGHRGNHVAALSWAAFMAQPTIMGRAGIAYSLLTKGIIKSHFIKWLETFARQSKYTEGSPNTFFLAIGSMLSKKGYMPYFEFLYSIMAKSLGQFSVYQTLLDNANIGTIKSAIVKIAKTWEAVDVPNPLQRRRGYKLDEYEIIQRVRDIVVLFISGGVVRDKTVWGANPHTDAIRLAFRVLTAPAMLLSLGIEDPGSRLNNLITKRVFQLRKPPSYVVWSPLEEFIHTLFVFFYVNFYEQLLEIYAEIDHEFHYNAPTTLDQWMALVDRTARYKEITQIMDRAVNKLNNEDIPERNLLESPLEALTMLIENEEEPEFSLRASQDFGPAAPAYLYALECLSNLDIPTDQRDGYHEYPFKIGDGSDPHIDRSYR